MSTPILHGGSKFRQGVLQLMIHSVDPLHEEAISSAMATNRMSIMRHHHVHPPGATTCVMCNEDETANHIFHTTINESHKNQLTNGSHLTQSVQV